MAGRWRQECSNGKQELPQRPPLLLAVEAGGEGVRSANQMPRAVSAVAIADHLQLLPAVSGAGREKVNSE